MSFKTLFTVVPVLSLLALTGCKKSCTDICDDAKDADCATTSTQTINDISGIPNSLFDHAGCVGMCQRQDDMESDDVSDCTTEFDTLMDCAKSQDNICNVWQIEDIDTDTAGDPNYPVTGGFKMRKCNSQWKDYQSCYSDFCADHTKRDYCN